MRLQSRTSPARCTLHLRLPILLHTLLLYTASLTSATLHPRTQSPDPTSLTHIPTATSSSPLLASTFISTIALPAEILPPSTFSTITVITAASPTTTTSSLASSSTSTWTSISDVDAGPETMVQPSTSTTSTCDPTPYADCTPINTFTPPTAHFGPLSPASLRVGAGIEAKAMSALASVTSTWTSSPQYTLLKGVIYEAAPTSIQPSLAIQGYDWDSILRSTWFPPPTPSPPKNDAIPQQWRDFIDGQIAALQRTYNSIVGIDDGSRTKSSDAVGRSMLLGWGNLWARTVVLGAVMILA